MKMDTILKKFFKSARSPSLEKEVSKQYSAQAWRTTHGFTIAFFPLSGNPLPLRMQITINNAVVERIELTVPNPDSISEAVARGTAPGLTPQASYLISFSRDNEGAIARLNMEEGKLKVGCNAFSLLDDGKVPAEMYAKVTALAAGELKRGAEKLRVPKNLPDILMMSSEIIGAHALHRDLELPPNPDLECGWREQEETLKDFYSDEEDEGKPELAGKKASAKSGKRPKANKTKRKK